MRITQVLMLATALVALIGCAEDETPNTTWQHSDGSPLNPVELAQSRAACDRSATRADLEPPIPLTGNPIYRPGGMGLETTSGLAGFGGTETLPNTPPVVSENAARVEACLGDKGIVRAP
jgi:hypothetical protein